MPETPFPSAAQTLDQAERVNGGVMRARRELVRRLKIALPALIVEFNAREGLTGNQALLVPKPGDFASAPKLVTGDHLGKILVATQVSTGDSGPGAFKNTVQVVVFSVDARVHIEEQDEQLFERAELIRAALLPYLNGCVDGQGRRVWRQLIPTGYGRLPDDWKEFSGMRVTFNMTQPPNMNSGE